jgi:hypothetical protein
MATCNAVLNPSGVLQGSAGYYFAIVLLAFTPLFILSTCAAFLYFQKRSMFLRKRKFFTVVITCFQVSSLLCYTAIYDVVGAANFPCLLLAITFNLFAAVQAVNLVFKVTLFLNNSAELEIGKEIAVENAYSEVSKSETSSSSSVFRPTYIPPKSTWKTFGSFCKSLYIRDKRKLSLDERIEALQFMKSSTYYVMLGPPVFFAAAATMGIRIGLDSDMQNNCMGCRVSMYEAIVQLVLTAWGMLLSQSVFNFVSTANDTLRLNAEVKETLGFPFVVPWLLGLILYLADVDGVNHTFNWLTLCLLCNMSMLFNHVWKLIYLSYRQRRDMFKSKRDLPACFEEVYADPELKQALCALLDSEMSSEIYWFYDSVKFYHRTYDQSSERSKELAKFNMENYVLSR